MGQQHDDDLEWLLCVVPGLLGVGSGHGGFVAALERGQVKGGIADSSQAEEKIHRVQPQLGQARLLHRRYLRLPRECRKTLEAHYTAPACRAAGVQATLGMLTGVCFYQGPRQALEKACRNPTEPQHAKLIRSSLRAAEKAVTEAHRAWRAARQEDLLAWIGEG
jgi:hypothetical protein